MPSVAETADTDTPAGAGSGLATRSRKLSSVVFQIPFGVMSVLFFL